MVAVDGPKSTSILGERLWQNKNFVQLNRLMKSLAGNHFAWSVLCTWDDDGDGGARGEEEEDQPTITQQNET